MSDDECFGKLPHPAQSMLTPVIAGCRVNREMPTITGVTVRLLGQRLKKLRQRHVLTQEAFAEIAGLNYKFYQQVESGRKKQLWLETVDRLAAGFGLEAWQLLSPTVPSDTRVLLPSSPSGKGRSKTKKENFPAPREGDLLVAEVLDKKYSAQARKQKRARAAKR